MSDSKDPQKGKGDPFSQLVDMESTVRIDFGGNQNVVSTSDRSSPIDFEKTLDGLTDIDEILGNDTIIDHNDNEPTVSFSTDEIDFDELDAGINALAEDFPAEKKAEEDGDEPLDDLDTFLKDADALESTTYEQTVTIDALDEQSEPAKKAATSDTTFDEWPLLDADSEEEATADVDAADEDDLDSMDLAADEQQETDEQPPVIELTEEMLDETEEESSGDDSESSQDSDIQDETSAEDFADTDQAVSTGDNIAETPELTTTETNILAGATEAIHKIAEEEEMKMRESEAIREPVGQFPVSPAAANTTTNSSSNTLPVMLALLGMAAGSVGAWMAWDATNKITDLEMQIHNLQSAKGSDANRQSIADIQQRLTKVERRLTGTPTIEAAATLGESTNEEIVAPSTEEEVAAAQAMAVVDNKPAAKAITPDTKVSQPQTDGDWVVNLSSHMNESAATQEKARLIKLGLNAEVHSATIKNKIWYRVQIIGFATKGEAKAQLRDIQDRSGIKGAWVGKKIEAPA